MKLKDLMSDNFLPKFERNQKLPNFKNPPNMNQSYKPSIKENILNSACNMMNRMGFNESNISEIALEAGIKEPIIYKYFKDKEDLLFSVVEDQMAKYSLFLKEHLTGINGVDQKFRKYIWAHLRYNDINRDYITLVVLECRSNPNFYKTKAYELIRKTVGVLTEIVIEGSKEGIFRQDVNLWLFRDLVFGLMDFEAITCLVTNEIHEAAPDHEDIMKLLERILFAKFRPKTSPIDKKQRILRAAIKMFAEKGYTGATISEIASLANIADGSIYEYFKNKEDLLLSIPEERFKEHINRLQETFNDRNSTKKIRRFIEFHFGLYLNDFDFVKVCLILILLNRRFYQSGAYQSLRQYVKVFEDLVEEGVKDGSFNPDTNIRIFRNMFLGAFTHMLLRWIFRSEGRSIDKMYETNEIVDLLCNAIVVSDR